MYRSKDSTTIRTRVRNKSRLDPEVSWKGIGQKVNPGLALKKGVTKFPRLCRNVMRESSLVSSLNPVEQNGIEKGKTQVWNKIQDGVCACRSTAGIENL